MLRKKDLVSPPQPQRPDQVAWSGVEAYKSCYCCHGTGYVVRIERILSDPHIFTRPVLCKRVGCTAASKVQVAEQIVDNRLTPQECQELHKLGLADWHSADRNWHESRQRALIEQMSAPATKSLRDET